MYAGLSRRGDENGREREREERHIERRELAEKAQAEYPDLHRRRAVETYKEKAKAQLGTDIFVRENAPILLAVAAGLVVMTFLRKRRR